MEEREFFDERSERKMATLNCPHCHQAAEYELVWLVRTKKKQLSGRADERDRARFAKARSYMLRKDDLVACKNVRCRKRIEITSVQSVAFLDWVALLNSRPLLLTLLTSIPEHLCSVRTGGPRVSAGYIFVYPLVIRARVNYPPTSSLSSGSFILNSLLDVALSSLESTC